MTTIERAFDLARSGDCTTLGDIKRRLHGEGHPRAHVEDQLFGKSITKQLRALCDEARRAAAVS